MTFTSSNTANEQVSAFQSLDTDQQLALFWFVYKEMGKSVTPAAPGAETASPVVAEALYGQVEEMSHEEQLQLQRDLVNRVNTPIARQYGALSDTTKLLFWYLLAQGMDRGTVVPMPPNYEMNESAKALFEQIKGMEFHQQISFFRDIVSPMGVDPNAVEHDPETGL